MKLKNILRFLRKTELITVAICGNTLGRTSPSKLKIEDMWHSIYFILPLVSKKRKP